MGRHLSNAVVNDLIAIARRVVGGIENGDIRPEPGAEKKLRDLYRKAKQALAMAIQQHEVRHDGH